MSELIKWAQILGYNVYHPESGWSTRLSTSPIFPKLMIERYPAQHWPPTVVKFGSSRSPGNFQLFPPLLQWEPYHLHSIGTCNRLLKPSAYWAAANWAENLRWCDFVWMLPCPDFELTEQCWCKQLGFMIPTQSRQDSRGYSKHSALPYLHISSCISSVHLPSSSTFHLCIFLPYSTAMRSISNRCRSPHLRQRLRRPRPRRRLPRQRGAGRAGRAVGLSPKPQGAPVGWPRVVDFHREMVVDLVYLMDLVWWFVPPPRWCPYS